MTWGCFESPTQPQLFYPFHGPKAKDLCVYEESPELSKLRLSNGFSKLRPILPALNTVTYKWEKFFVPLLRHLTYSEFTLKGSFEFVKVICEQDAALFMASLDVDFLFTNVPLEETINICVYGYSKVIVVFMVLTKNKLPRCFL